MTEAARRDMALARRSKLTIGRLTATVLLIGAMLRAADLYSFHERSLHDGERRAASLTSILSAYLRETFRSADASLRQLVIHGQTIGGSTAPDSQWNPILNAAKAGLPGIGSLTVTDAQGIIRHSTIDLLVGQSRSDEYVFRQLAQGSRDVLVASTPFQSLTGRNVLIPIGRALNTNEGVFDGTVVATIVPEELRSLFRSVDVGPNGMIWVFHPDGLTLFREPSTVDPIGEDARHNAIFKEARRLESPGTVLGPAVPQGPNLLSAFNPISEPPLVVSVSLSEDEVLSDWRREVAISAGLLIAVLAGVGVGLLLIFRQIDASAAARQAVRAGEEHLALIYNGVDDPIYLLTVEPGNRLRFLSTNRAFLVATGLGEDQIVGRLLDEVLTPLANPWVVSLCHRAMREQRRVRGQGPTDTRLGAPTVEISISPIFDEAGSCIQLLGSSHDVTERMRAEELQLQAVRLTEESRLAHEANRLKSEFLASMSHELRTPLNAILGFSDLLLQEGQDEFGASDRQLYLETINTSGQHLLGLINDILDLSKVEAGKMDLRWELVRLDDVIRQVCATLGPLAANKGITLTLDVEAAGQLTADAGKLKQVLYNLLSNAIKFTPDDGQVIVSARRLDSSTEIVVTDTGIGISGEDLERVFVEFQQLDTGPGRRYEGTGLGLALTKQLVELHGGSVRVKSVVGQGTTFTVTLPHQASKADLVVEGSVTPPPVSTPVGLDGPLVLIVEDDVGAANLLSVYVGRAGYRTEVAVDGLQAVEKAKALQPVAITLDILLPELDGWEVLRVLKLDPSTRDIPVVVVSVVDDERMGRALGAVDYLVKPVDRQMLLAHIDRFAGPANTGKQRELRVLIVDDEPASVDLLAHAVAQAGYKALTATGGADGIALARQQLPDLILLDLLMPDVDGFEVVDTLKDDRATRDIPILIITSKDLTLDDKKALNGRAAAIFAKGALPRLDLIDWLNDINRRSAPSAA